MFIKRLKSIVERSIEIIVSAVLVLVFFALFLFFMDFFFPTGTPLKESINRINITDFTGISDSVEHELRIQRGDEEAELTAELTWFRKQVKTKRATGIAWRPADVGMTLYHRDAVQTLNRASAQIKLDKESHIELGENTLVIIRRLDQDLFLGNKDSVLLMVDGMLHGRIRGSDQISVNVEVATPHAVTKVVSEKSEDDQAEFKISVNPDKSSTITVYHGSAEVEAQGEVVRVERNQGVVVNFGETPPVPETLPSAPMATTPEDREVLYYRDLPPKVRFSWDAEADVEMYHFVLSRDPDFRELLVNERLREREFVYGNLKEGRYYWRVSGLVKWKESTFSEARNIFVVIDQKPPVLHVQFPQKIADKDDEVIVTGLTEPNADLFIQSKPVPIDKGGGFRYVLRVQPGMNVIVVEAMDAAGNVAYRAKRLYGRF